jgi:hypothetical protein
MDVLPPHRRYLWTWRCSLFCEGVREIPLNPWSPLPTPWPATNSRRDCQGHERFLLAEVLNRHGLQLTQGLALCALVAPGCPRPWNHPVLTTRHGNAISRACWTRALEVHRPLPHGPPAGLVVRSAMHGRFGTLGHALGHTPPSNPAASLGPHEILHLVACITAVTRGRFCARLVGRFVGSITPRSANPRFPAALPV